MRRTRTRRPVLCAEAGGSGYLGSDPAGVGWSPASSSPTRGANSAQPVSVPIDTVGFDLSV